MDPIWYYLDADNFLYIYLGRCFLRDQIEPKNQRVAAGVIPVLDHYRYIRGLPTVLIYLDADNCCLPNNNHVFSFVIL